MRPRTRAPHLGILSAPLCYQPAHLETSSAPQQNHHVHLGISSALNNSTSKSRVRSSLGPRNLMCALGMRTWKRQVYSRFAPTNFRCVAHAHLETPSALGKCTSKLCMRKLLHLEMSHVRLLGALGIRKCVDVRTQESQVHRVSQQPAHSGIPSALVASNPGILDPPAWCIWKSHVLARLLGIFSCSASAFTYFNSSVSIRPTWAFRTTANMRLMFLAVAFRLCPSINAESLAFVCLMLSRCTLWHLMVVIILTLYN